MRKLNAATLLRCLPRFVRGWIECPGCDRPAIGKWTYVERPDGLHDQFLLCKTCRSKTIKVLQPKLYPPNVEAWRVAETDKR